MDRRSDAASSLSWASNSFLFRLTFFLRTILLTFKRLFSCVFKSYIRLHQAGERKKHHLRKPLKCSKVLSAVGAVHIAGVIHYPVQ
jgi:hypothetical protein